MLFLSKLLSFISSEVGNCHKVKINCSVMFTDHIPKARFAEYTQATEAKGGKIM